MFFNAESTPDNTLYALADHADLIVFGEHSGEVWYNSGETVPFSRRPGYQQEIGLGARYSVAQLDNTVFFMTDKYQISRVEGILPKAISTRGIDYQIAQYAVKDDAIAMTASIEGNSFYILTFPTEGVTWCFNVVTGGWNKLASYPEPYSGRWRGNCSAFFNGQNYIGDYQNGKIYKLDFETYQDNSNTIIRKRITAPLRQENKLLLHRQLEIFFEPGVGLDAGVQGSDPTVMLRYSDDGGITWGSEIWRSIGKIGKYKWRAVWHRLGAARERVYQITMSDPVKWVITGANLEAELAAS